MNWNMEHFLVSLLTSALFLGCCEAASASPCLQCAAICVGKGAGRKSCPRTSIKGPEIHAGTDCLHCLRGDSWAAGARDCERLSRQDLCRAVDFVNRGNSPAEGVDFHLKNEKPSRSNKKKTVLNLSNNSQTLQL